MDQIYGNAHNTCYLVFSCDLALTFVQVFLHVFNGHGTYYIAKQMNLNKDL